MTPLMLILTAVSLAGLMVFAVFRYLQDRDLRFFLFLLFGIVLTAVLLYAFFYIPAQVTPKGEGKEIAFVIVLYICMLMGMFSNFLYARFTKIKEKREKFDFGTFIAPVFASPIVFIPLLAAFQETGADMKNFTIGKTMIFLVAFQNGFFWKEYFDNVQKEQKSAAKKSTKKKDAADNAK